jgi:tetratricopeptide (TPR) repeat protein
VNRRVPALVCLSLGLLTLLLFAPCLQHAFLDYDDQQYVTENPHVLAGLSWPGVVWAFKSFYASNWHPLTWLSHMLDCQLYGLHPAGHHLTNVLLHVANTVLLFLLLRGMTGALWRSATVAALFAWHPLHVESVAWIAERKDVLSALFFLLTLLAYTGYARKPEVEQSREREEGRGRSQRGVPSSLSSLPSSALYILAFVLFALGLLSKPMLVSLPFILLLLDLWPLQRFRWPFPPVRLLLEKVPFLLLSAGCAVLTILAQGQSHSLVSSAALPFGARLGHALVAYVHYLGAMFVPRHLVAYYPYQSTASHTEIALAAILLLVLTVLAFSQAARRPYFLVGWLWYLVMLVPVIGLVQVGDQAWADRYTYLPLIGPFIALVWGAAELFPALQSPKLIPSRKESDCRGAQASACAPTLQPNRSAVLARPPAGGFQAGVLQTAMAVVALSIGAVMVAATSLQIRYWRNTRTLFEHALQVTPRNARALAVLGSLLAKDGKIQQAKELYRQALVYRPDDPEAHFFMGVALAHENQFDEALAEYCQALWFKPLEAKTHLFMGVALAKQQKYEEAAAHYRTVLALEPDSATAHNDLARVLHSQGRLKEAVEHYAAALKLDPNLAQAHNNLGVLLLQSGRLDEGAMQLREAVRLNPADAESQYNFSLALNQQQKWSDAAEILSRLEPTRSQDPNLQNQLALALAHLAKTRDAMSHYAQALLLRQDFPEALEGLAWLLSTDPHPEIRNGGQAVVMAERACELTGRKEPAALMTLAAAYAEAGRYADAAAAAQDALALAEAASRNDIAIKCRALASSAKEGKPWREGANRE